MTDRLTRQIPRHSPSGSHLCQLAGRGLLPAMVGVEILQRSPGGGPTAPLTIQRVARLLGVDASVLRKSVERHRP